ncbi:hypothetical protein yc1106_08238 [Curvularia clavata]|uniref:Dicer-like protein 2 n=1 Tax=Curvularia clavata TaxID=95742 RepID=A0A9Q9DWJ1_CURCL|nr:hypothetical protein yc1106_08238 [Curvularia clavata]
MGSPQHNSDSGLATVMASNEPFRLRGYQAEMVEESMKANTIVVMDTGSGKTHISAIERTRAELETCEPNKIVWFLAPTVALCEQQYEVFQSNLPGYIHLLLCGRDDVELWTTQNTWDRVLRNVRIVLSTHQILLDALSHGFVRLSRLALLIFDEVRVGSKELPKILGLTASPVMKAAANKRSLEEIEQNLQATARTPKQYRSELIRHVHQPEVIQVNYTQEFLSKSPSVLLLALQNECRNYDLMQDPYIIALMNQQRNGYNVSRQLEKIWISGKTYCYDHLKQLVSKAEAMAEEMGKSVMEHFLHHCVSNFANLASAADHQLLELSSDERQHLLNILQPLLAQHITVIPVPLLESLSHKVNVLIDILVNEATASSTFTGLVFVEQRVWVASLAEILTSHPRTKSILRVATFVGTSQTSKRKGDLSTFAEPKNQQSTLDKFKAGIINLVLATSVLEEGIDIPSCHLVVCFEHPKNLKGFIQRRGRARQHQSRLYIFAPNTGVTLSPASWQLLETELRKAYEDDKRQVLLAQAQEKVKEDGSRCFKVSSTGALLTLDNACQHLYHFCARLTSSTYGDTQPEFDFTSVDGQITAKVTLPISIPPALRMAKSFQTWKTEKMARKDAAFEAYRALYDSGLVNENLLPVRDEEEELTAQDQCRNDQPSLIPVSFTVDPWKILLQNHHNSSHEWYRTLLNVTAPGEEPSQMILLTPHAVPAMPDVLLHWNESKRYNAKTSSLPSAFLTDADVQLLRSITWTMLRSVFGVYVEDDAYDFVYLLAPCSKLNYALSMFELEKWHAETRGQRSAQELVLQGNVDPRCWGLATRQEDMRRYIVKAIRLLPSTASVDAEEPFVEAVRFPKRRDFLHPIPESDKRNEAYAKVETLGVSSCVVDNLPVSQSILALFLPSIAHRLEVHMAADILRTSLLKHVDIDNSHLPLIVLALTSSAADAVSNYQRLEFLGDCILKFITSLHLMATYPHMPEGMLTDKKGRIVSNGNLARAALHAGLDRFILYNSFTGAKWRPKYISQLVADTSIPCKQEKSPKLIADIVESLIGASYLAGGLSKAFTCVKSLLPSENWMSIWNAHYTLYNATPDQATVRSLTLVERLLGYTFNNKVLLVDALTHSTFRGVNTHCSYEREEFLGDAVLDYIISKNLYAYEPGLPHHKMHSIRTAMVNASFLTYSMFETTVEEELTSKETLQSQTHQRALWQFLRFTSYELAALQSIALRRHVEARAQIAAALEHDARFPWQALSLTDPPKFLSDIVESVIGALYIDSHGSISVCEEFIRRLGILRCLERILSDDVDCLHPKERLGILAVDKTVTYVHITSDTKRDEGKSIAMNDTTYKVQVRIGGQDVGDVVKGVKRLQAETIAAWRAIEIIERVGVEYQDMREEDEVFFDAEEDGGVRL